MTEALLFLALLLALGWPLGHYLAAVMQGAPMRSDPLFTWLERPIYRLLGTHPRTGMGWSGLAGSGVGA